MLGKKCLQQFVKEVLPELGDGIIFSCVPVLSQLPPQNEEGYGLCVLINPSHVVFWCN